MHEAHVTGVAEGLERLAFVAGGVVLADRGYNHPAAILGLDDRQVRVVVRLNPVAMPLFERPEAATGVDSGQSSVDLARYLRGFAGDRVSLPVWLRGGRRFGAGRVHARRRCRQSARRKDRTPGADTL